MLAVLAQVVAHQPLPARGVHDLDDAADGRGVLGVRVCASGVKVAEVTGGEAEIRAKRRDRAIGSDGLSGAVVLAPRLDVV